MRTAPAAPRVLGAGIVGATFRMRPAGRVRVSGSVSAAPAPGRPLRGDRRA